MSGRQTARPSLLAGAGHLAALWALAFVQPLFDLLGRNPEFFVARGNSSSEILVFAFTFTLAPPLGMLALEWICSRISSSLRWGVHLGLLGLLSAALALQVLELLASRPAGLLIAAALAAGIGLALAYARTRFLRSMLDVLIPSPVLILALFLLTSSVSELVLPQSEARAAALKISGRAPVVVVVFDELPEGTLMTRQGRIDASRFPAFATLARDSTWYRGATTVSAFTPRAVPAILTGTLPDTEDLPTSADQPRSIFTLLGAAYRMHVNEEVTQICPSGLCGERDPGPGASLGSLFSDLRVVSEHLLLPNALRRKLPPIDVTFGDFAKKAGNVPRRLRFADSDAERLTAAFGGQVTDEEQTRMASFVAGIHPGPRVLHLIHVLKPHYPWTHFAGGHRYSDLSSEFREVLADDTSWIGPRSLTDLALQRHMLEAGFTDRLLGDVIARLRQTGLWNRALVVVLADHGGAFIPYEPRRNPTARNLGQVAPVPLLVKAPGQKRPRTVDRHVCTTDVVPQIARRLGVDYPWRRLPCPATEVTVADGTSGETSLPFARVERLRDAFARRIRRLFGNGKGWGPVLRFAPHAELVGRRVEDLRLAAPGPESASPVAPGRLENVDLRRPTVAFTLQRGSISGSGPGDALAIAVNGRIAAVGRSFEADGMIRYSMLVPVRFFLPGRNTIEIYRVLGGGRAPRLERIGP